MFPQIAPYDYGYPPWSSLKDYPTRFFTSPNVALEIGIVGAGIAGLTAAIALSRCGHNVEVYERAASDKQVSAVTIGPNAMPVLRQLEFDFLRAKALVLEGSSTWDGSSLELKTHLDYSQTTSQYGDPCLVTHCQDLLEELKRLALKRSSTYPAVKIHYHTPVISVDCQGALTLAGGKTVEKDVIIGADGADTTKSLVAAQIIDEEAEQSVQVRESTFRFIIPTESLLNNDLTRPLFMDKPPTLNVAVSGDKRIVWYPCRNDKLQNFVALHPPVADGHGDDDGLPCSGKLCATYEQFHPALREICKLAGDITFKHLAITGPRKLWTQEKVILIGDAAHSMLPHQGQCESQAIEDAAALSVFLSYLKDKRDVEKRLLGFQKVRRGRAGALQILSNVGQEAEQSQFQELKKAAFHIQGPMPRTSLELNQFKFAYRVFSDCLDALAMEE